MLRWVCTKISISSLTLMVLSEIMVLPIQVIPSCMLYVGGPGRGNVGGEGNLCGGGEKCDN